MSPAVPAPPVSALPESTPAEKVRETSYGVFGHTNLFYWWPVWLVGFILAGLTYLDGHVMAVVPEGTVVAQGKVIPGESGPRDVLVAPAGQTVPLQPRENAEQQ